MANGTQNKPTSALGTTAAAAKSSKPTATLAKVLRLKRNKEAATWFATGICGIICLVAIFYWTAILCKRFGLDKSRRGLLRIPLRVSRLVRRQLLRKVPGFTSGAHALVFLAYFAICLPITFTNINWENLTQFAKRLGWLTAANLALVVFLGLKNTPLAILTAQSYERLNRLHQVAGYATVACALMHATVYTINWHYAGIIRNLLEHDEYMGMTAAFAMVVILLTALFLRRAQYETFYIIHIVMAALAIIMAALHRPHILETRSSFAMVFAGTVWALDRIFRFSRLSFFSFRNTATLTPLPHGLTRIVLKKSPKSAVPGTHCFIWIPEIRVLESHPFTVMSTDPTEMIVASYDGFTRDLHRCAVKTPGITLKASIEGPYGVVPDLISFDHVVFIAGGSGASYTCGLAADLLRKLEDSSTGRIDFTWVVKEKETLDWASTCLQELASSSLVTLRLHTSSNLTGDPFMYTPNGSHISLPHISSSISEKQASSKHQYDLEKYGIPTPSTTAGSGITVYPGRPSISAIIRNCVTDAAPRDRIAIVACGPGRMMLEVRKATAESITLEGASVELFVEHFDW